MSPPADLTALSARLDRLEAESAARRVVTDYFRLCDTLGPQTSMAALASLFTPDAIWEGQGRYRTAFGRHEGRDAIIAMLSTYADPPHFRLNQHYLSSEAIEILDQDHVIGRWAMLQASTYHDGRSDLRSAALSVDLRLDAGVWRIARFVTTGIFARHVTAWSDEAAIPVPLGAGQGGIV